jgi:hypothetical protein
VRDKILTNKNSPSGVVEDEWDPYCLPPQAEGSNGCFVVYTTPQTYTEDDPSTGGNSEAPVSQN